ncbi:MAG: hypothetical protein ACRC33_00805 [Gemmataceae bacterium]
MASGDEGPGQPEGAEPPATFAKRVVDPLNTAAWFAMDAMWMCKLDWPAYAFAGLTVVTGLWLLALGWRERRGVLLADLGLNCWIAMNTVWLVWDLNGQPAPLAVAVPLAVLGAAFLAAAGWHSEDFRRLRIRGR